MSQSRVHLEGVFCNSAKELAFGFKDAVLLLFVVLGKLQHLGHYFVDQLLYFRVQPDYRLFILKL